MYQLAPEKVPCVSVAAISLVGDSLNSSTAVSKLTGHTLVLDI